MEHSERGRYVTEQVAVWIENDGEHIADARRLLEWRGVPGLEKFLRNVMNAAPNHSAPWQVAQELAPNDYGRVDWATVADRIKPE